MSAREVGCRVVLTLVVITSYNQRRKCALVGGTVQTILLRLLSQ